MFNNLIFFKNLIKTSIKASISRRFAFLIETTLMIANNLIFFSIWWVFFSKFQEVEGWSFNDMTMLVIVGSGSYGLMQVCFGGIRDLSNLIQNGNLDPFMTQPKNILLNIAGSKSLARGWGQLFTAFLLTIFAQPPVYLLPIIFICILSGCIVFTSINIIAHSLPFWLGAVESFSKKYCDALFLFSLYPTNIYSGFLQVIMFTFIPAGIISFLPVEIIRSFSWNQFLILLCSSGSFLFIACFIFYKGLQKYESGNRFAIRL